MKLFCSSKQARLGRWGLLAGGLLGVLAFRGVAPPGDDDTTAVLRRLVLGIRQYYQTARPETTYLHLDKDAYTAGETVWLRAYVVEAGQHRPDTLSKVLHVELLGSGQRVVARRQLELTGGLAAGDIALPDTLGPGTYLLRAYTGWMRNAPAGFFYTRQVQVWPAAEPEAVPETRAAFRRAAGQARQRVAQASAPPDVQFFAEGGNLVAGLDNVVAFKAVNYAGESFELMGQVLDSHSHPVATFGSRHGGMGSFRLTPVAGEHYTARFTSAQAAALAVPLPPVQASGYVMQVATTADAFDVTIRQRGGSGGAVLLLGQVGSTVGYLGQGRVQGQEIFAATIPKSKFASGIVHFTLFDGQGQPLAERLAFALNEPPLRVSLTPSQPTYGPHQPVQVRVAVADAAGRPVATELSVAVADAGLANPWADNIAARLLLTADLAGYVENPGYYFDQPTADTRQHLDDLLLTQGWRRFAWPQVLAGQVPAPEFGLERSVGILGQVTHPDGKPAPQSTITFLRAKPVPESHSMRTDAEGRFLLNGLQGCDTVRATLQARSAKNKRNLLISPDYGPARPGQPLPPLPLAPAPALAAALQRGQAQQADERRFRLANTVALGTVKVVGQRAVEPDARRIYAPGNATVIDMNLVPSAGGTTLLQSLQGRVPGLSITGAEPSMQVLIRGTTSFSGSSPLFLLDGVPVTQEALAFYPASDVERVELLKGGQAAIFGSRGAGGVLAVYTRRGNPTYDHRQDAAPGVLAVRWPAYNCPRQFYAPRYGAGAPPPTRPDTRRSTLYWNPAVQTDATGQATFTFYTSEARGTFRLRAEGLAATGQPALGTGRLEVQ